MKLLLNPSNALFVGSEEYNKKIVNSKYRLSDFAYSVTGVYSGNNQKFLAIEQGNRREISGYPIISKDKISYEHFSICPVGDAKEYILIAKGSSCTQYYRTADKWLIKWTDIALHHYKTDKKARLQNSAYYFRKGIAMPTVKSSRVKASIINGCVFDQSIVGVFPRDEKYLFYILAYLNSKIANELIHIINPTANNSANYLKKLPMPFPTDADLQKVNFWVSEILRTREQSLYQQLIDEFFMQKMQEADFLE